jgi:hypothetical protein
MAFSGLAELSRYNRQASLPPADGWRSSRR